MKLGKYTYALDSFITVNFNEARRAQCCENPLEFQFSDDFAMCVKLYCYGTNLVKFRAFQIMSQFNLTFAVIRSNEAIAEEFLKFVKLRKEQNPSDVRLHHFMDHFYIHTGTLVEARLGTNIFLDISANKFFDYFEYLLAALNCAKQIMGVTSI